MEKPVEKVQFEHHECKILFSHKNGNLLMSKADMILRLNKSLQKVFLSQMFSLASFNIGHQDLFPLFLQNKKTQLCFFSYGQICQLKG